MQPDWNIFRAMLYCPYKAWNLAREYSVQKEINQQKNLQPTASNEPLTITIPVNKITTSDRLCIAAVYFAYQDAAVKKSFHKISIVYGAPGSLKSSTINVSRYVDKVRQLTTALQKTIDSDVPPVFYKNPHCPICQYRNVCYQKLKERDCISILAGMSPKVLEKYHRRGIFSITQLSYLFRPRRRSRMLQATGSFIWELKALAIREQKTYIMNLPELRASQASIYIDFEGMPEDDYQYLVGGFIWLDNNEKENFSFWADDKNMEATIFQKLFEIFRQYPDSIIYHYGSYEIKCLKQFVVKQSSNVKKEWTAIEKRMVNLLAFLRTHVFPPIYGNGLKELASFLGFQWKDSEADGLKSITWRRNWEQTRLDIWKNQLLQYNRDDCLALAKVQQWLQQLVMGPEHVQVDQMKRHTPYKLDDNHEYGEDFQIISKAAYFDYQRSKIYWRNQGGPNPAASVQKQSAKRHLRKGVTVWQPGKPNEIITAPPLKKCPSCGHKKLYQLKTHTSSFKQTDLKFSPSGIRQYVREYRSVISSCAKCKVRRNNQTMRMLHYGDNFFAFAINLYVNYHISHDLISRTFAEQFGILINPMYLIQRKHKWWRKWKPEVDYIWTVILHSPVIHIDETPIKLSKDKGYVWVFATSHAVYYHFTLTRQMDFLNELLKDYKGIIITDFYLGYETLAITQQKCLIHLIRDLNDDLFRNPFDEEYKRMVDAFGSLLRTIIETIDRFGLKTRHLKKHMKDTERFFKRYLEKEYQSEYAIKCSKRLKKHWDYLWIFLSHDNVSWNNNNAETAIKAFAQHRRGVNGQMSEKGLREYLEMLSIAQTCRYRNISFLGFLRRKKGIWENVPASYLPGFLPFEQAKLFVRRLGFKRKSEWESWKEAGNCPSFIPTNPDKNYRNKGWIKWSDWFGIT